MAVHLTSSDREGFYKKCCTFNAVDGSDEVGDTQSANQQMHTFNFFIY